MRVGYTIVALVLAGILATAVVVVWPKSAQISETDTFSAPGLDPLTISAAQSDFWRLTPALLLEVYKAFGETQEDAIYDTLASVTHGGALEYLYLERVGAMKGGGLDEVDQTIHEIKLLNTQVAREEQLTRYRRLLAGHWHCGALRTSACAGKHLQR